MAASSWSRKDSGLGRSPSGLGLRSLGWSLIFLSGLGGGEREGRVWRPSLSGSSRGCPGALELVWELWVLFASCLGALGVAWGSPELSGSFWSFLELFGALWSCLELSELCGAVWSSLELSGALWSCLELSRTVWSCLASKFAPRLRATDRAESS